MKTGFALPRKPRESVGMALTMPSYAPDPDQRGFYAGGFGGRYIPETLMPAVEELDRAYRAARHDPKFHAEFNRLLTEYAGRPSSLMLAERLTARYGGPRIYLKREDLNHTGAHKINNTLGQILLTRRMKKKRVIAETGAGQHGVATATVAALFGLECVVYMGAEDIRRQEPNVFRMKLMGAEVVAVHSGSCTLKDACNEAMRDWMKNVGDTHYIIGSCMGPHPYPMMVRDFQSVIGREAREQILEREGRLPTALVACVGGGSNAIGLFAPFYGDKKVQMYGVEAAGEGLKKRHAATISKGRNGILHGMSSIVLQAADGQTAEVHSISAGLDYPGVGPEHAFYARSGRAHYVSATDAQALDAFQRLAQLEGIIPALESAHAIAYLETLAPKCKKNDILIVNLSGRGDKDCPEIMRLLAQPKVTPPRPPPKKRRHEKR